MTKDEMKNKISMALKDPTLQQGFEIICKELEAEKQLNAEIKARFVKCNTCTDEMKSKCLMFSESLCQGERCEELVDLMGLISKSELEKENTELKKELQKWKDEWQEQVQKATDEGYVRTLQTIQLSKAKELLKGWLDDYYSPKPFYQQRAELVKQSEQFVSEVEK